MDMNVINWNRLMTRSGRFFYFRFIYSLSKSFLHSWCFAAKAKAFMVLGLLNSP